MAPDPIPRTHQVIPGARVNIILKADQPTGRQVRGTVRHVLTRGDHHRGIKVRLTDGRIGRVQSMALDDSSTQSSSSSTSPGTDGSNPYPSPIPTDTREPRNPGHRPRYRDVRFEEPLNAPPEQIDLGAYMVPSRRRGRGKGRTDTDQADEMGNPENSQNSSNNQGTVDISSAIATCPVCEAFEGDEAAVSHHVTEHFGS
ncbi:putative mfs multidrug transporter [Rosellinia necatrix]|uniref:Putative mfs multidrug transporter n=1 Tax=Rosellinia necatrix TaxID=77044 RepID=A0A1S7UHS3_ROSNE|nr:putative mfs multidrug transporter [Rosellinia necatrix]